MFNFIKKLFCKHKNVVIDASDFASCTVFCLSCNNVLT